MYRVFLIVAVATLAPCSAQVATQTDIEMIDRKLVDLDARLRALEHDKTRAIQSEREADLRQQEQANQQMLADCAAYRRRQAQAKPGEPLSTGRHLLDELDKFNCDKLNQDGQTLPK